MEGQGSGDKETEGIGMILFGYDWTMRKMPTKEEAEKRSILEMNYLLKLQSIVQKGGVSEKDAHEIFNTVRDIVKLSD